MLLPLEAGAEEETQRREERILVAMTCINLLNLEENYFFLSFFLLLHYLRAFKSSPGAAFN